jgi:DnaJ-class molecular chaperone
MAGADPYEILGVARDSSPKDIRKAYRRLAKTMHPDLNPGDKDAQRRFQDLSGAYDILSDETKRARFDRGEIDASGAERPQRQYYRDFAQAGGGSQRYETSSGFADFGNADDILSAFFSRGGRRGFAMQGEDRRYQLEVDFLDAVNGTTQRITLPDGTTLDVRIPPGTRDGQTLRLAGKGEPGSGGQPGDALIEISVRPHPVFKRDGNDIRLNLPISLVEAVLGDKVTIPTPSGPVKATIPKGSNTGKVLRLKGKGVPGPRGKAGDEYVTLQVMLPDPPDPELEDFVSHWTAGRAHNPRTKMRLR